MFDEAVAGGEAKESDVDVAEHGDDEGVMDADLVGDFALQHRQQRTADDCLDHER